MTNHFNHFDLAWKRTIFYCAYSHYEKMPEKWYLFHRIFYGNARNVVDIGKSGHRYSQSQTLPTDVIQSDSITSEYSKFWLFSMSKSPHNQLINIFSAMKICFMLHSLHVRFMLVIISTSGWKYSKIRCFLWNTNLSNLFDVLIAFA